METADYEIMDAFKKAQEGARNAALDSAADTVMFFETKKCASHQAFTCIACILDGIRSLKSTP